jgi:hypothetical protein
MNVYYNKGVFTGSATAAGTINDTIVGGYGTAGRWTQDAALRSLFRDQ